MKYDINNENNLLCITEKVRENENSLSNNNNLDIFYNTYYDTEYIKNEPTRYLTDVFSVGYNFNFIEETEIYPEFRYYINQKLYEKKLSSQNTEINGFNTIEYGPFYFMNQSNDEIISVVELIIKDKKNKIIFKKFYKVPDYRDYSFQPKYLDRTLNFKFITSSCYSLPGYRNPDITCYSKLAEIAREANPEYILCIGDIVYLEPLNISSKLAVQGAYDQLKSFEPIKNIWSNHTWICSNDDHELGYNDILAGAPDIRTLRETMTENFPLNELTNVIETRCGSFISKNITWIILDDISNRVFNKNYTEIGYNKFSSALGKDQLLFLINALSNV